MAARPARRVIDSHVHLWDRARFAYPWISVGSSLDRDWLPADLCQTIAGLPIEGGVLVEAANTLIEISWLVACAKALPGDWGVVGWLPLDQPDAPDQIARWTAEPRVKGFRLNWTAPLQQSPALDVYIAALAGGGFSLDILCSFEQLPVIADFAREHEDSQIILDHFAGAPLGRKHLDSLAVAIERFSHLEHVSVKVSGFASCDSASLRAMLSLYDGVFGPGRLLFGSDFPISLGAHRYPDLLALVEDATNDRTVFWRDALFSQSARIVYRLHAAVPLENASP